MTETVDTREMARLLDEWADAPNPFVPDFQPSFGLSDEQRREPLVQAATDFASFGFRDGNDSKLCIGPFFDVGGTIRDTIDRIQAEHPEAFGWWHDFASLASHPFVAAKLHDLLWLVGYSNKQQPFLYAEAAIVAYLRFYDEVVGRDFEPKEVHLCHLLCRAADLAKQINAADERHGDISKRCQMWLDNSSAKDHTWPIKVASRLRAAYRPPNLGACIQAAHAERAASPNHEVRTRREVLFKLELDMAQTTEEKQRVHTEAAEMFLDEAKRAPSDSMSHRHLRQAEEWAQNATGKADLLRAIKSANSDLDLTSDLQEISGEVAVSHDEIQALRDGVLGADNFALALLRIAMQGETTLLNIADLERDVDKSQKENAFVSLLPTLHMHQDGFECCHPMSDEAKREKAVAGAHKMQSQTDAVLWLKDCLRDIPRKYTLSEPHLAECLTVLGVIDQEDAVIFATAFRHYWNEEYVSCVRVAIPSIEATLRNLAASVGGVVTYRRRDEKCGGYIGVPAALDILEDSIGVNATRMLRFLLIDSHAMNLRDRSAHGIRSQKPDVDAALTLWIVAWLGLRVTSATR